MLFSSLQLSYGLILLLSTPACELRLETRASVSTHLQTQDSSETCIKEIDLRNELGLPAKRIRPIEFTPNGRYLIINTRVIETRDWSTCPNEIKGKFITSVWPDRVVLGDGDQLLLQDLANPNDELAILPGRGVNPRRVCAARNHPWFLAFERVPNSSSHHFQIRRVDVENMTNRIESKIRLPLNQRLIFNFSLMDNDRFVIIATNSSVYFYDLCEQVWLTVPALETEVLKTNSNLTYEDRHIARINWVHGAHTDTSFYLAVRGLGKSTLPFGPRADEARLRISRRICG